jgi:hypothetical protein
VITPNTHITARASGECERNDMSLLTSMTCCVVFCFVSFRWYLHVCIVCMSLRFCSWSYC